MIHMSFAVIEIRHQMARLLMPYSLTLTFIFKVNHCLVMHLLEKNAQAADASGRFDLTRTSPAVDLSCYTVCTTSPYIDFMIKESYMLANHNTCLFL